ncbi:MAG TPA: FAD-dependent oxidoreductase [Rhizomicrobium sp.]|nr:FAD-dependent oxidoreductase [Rhizomicrobium sp.]
MADTDVLIVGAGPTGLVLALWLAKLGVSVRILDKTDKPGTTSRALAVHARTLELYHQLDLAETVIQNGHKVPAVNLWVKGNREARVDFSDVGEGMTPYPFLHIFPQDEHEKLLIARLEALAIKVERRTELTGFLDSGDFITATIHGPNGKESLKCSYLAGCDGARSKTREITGIGFPGGTYQQVFYVADVEASGPPVDGELHVDLDEADFLALFPLKGQGRARLIGTVRDERAEHAESLKFEDVSDRAIHNLKVKVDQVNWFSTYRVHHRVANHFRKGRAFLLGDAAHIHSPAGGQGMNTGIGDAINLAWKLCWVLSGRAPDVLLDSYEQERIAFARKLVATTDRGFSFVSAEGPMADFIRTKVFPVVLPAAAHFQAFREFLFRTVSQIRINYRNDALSAGKVRAVEGGDRMPWLKDGANYKPLANMAWQAHVFGGAEPAIARWCDQRGVPLNVFAWDVKARAAGLQENALYLTRPDSYIAMAEPAPSPAVLDQYFAARGITP